MRGDDRLRFVYRQRGVRLLWNNPKLLPSQVRGAQRRERWCNAGRRVGKGDRKTLFIRFPSLPSLLSSSLLPPPQKKNTRRLPPQIGWCGVQCQRHRGWLSGQRMRRVGGGGGRLPVPVRWHVRQPHVVRRVPDRHRLRVVHPHPGLHPAWIRYRPIVFLCSFVLVSLFFFSVFFLAGGRATHIVGSPLVHHSNCPASVGALPILAPPPPSPSPITPRADGVTQCGAVGCDLTGGCLRGGVAGANYSCSNCEDLHGCAECTASLGCAFCEATSTCYSVPIVGKWGDWSFGFGLVLIWRFFDSIHVSLLSLWVLRPPLMGLTSALVCQLRRKKVHESTGDLCASNATCQVQKPMHWRGFGFGISMSLLCFNLPHPTDEWLFSLTSNSPHPRRTGVWSGRTPTATCVRPECRPARPTFLAQSARPTLPVDGAPPRASVSPSPPPVRPARLCWEGCHSNERA